MYRHILLPTDGSELSKAALKHGIALAKTIGARVTALVVSTPLHSLVVDPAVVSNAMEQCKALVATQTAKYLDNVRKDAKVAGVDCTAVCIEHDKRELAPASAGALAQIDQRRFGDTVVSIYRFA